MYKVLKTEYNYLTEKDQLVIDHIPLAINIATKFYSPEGEHEKDDLIQVALIGLIKATENFNYDNKIKFSTYAYHSCKGELLKYLRDYNFIKTPRKITDAKSLVNKYKTQGYTDEEIKNILKEDFNYYLEYKKLKGYNSLDASLNVKNDSEMNLHDIISNENKFEDTFCDNLELKEAYELLDEFEKKILDLSFNEEKTQYEIAILLNTNQSKVNRTLKKALNKMKTYLNKNIA